MLSLPENATSRLTERWGFEKLDGTMIVSRETLVFDPFDGSICPNERYPYLVGGHGAPVTEPGELMDWPRVLEGQRLIVLDSRLHDADMVFASRE